MFINLMKFFILRPLGWFGITLDDIRLQSLHAAVKEQNLIAMIHKLKEIVPDISDQYTKGIELTPYNEFKQRSVHAFQCKLMLKAFEFLSFGTKTVVDIGDSSGNHMLYLKELINKNDFQLSTVSVNLDPNAVEKIRSKGFEALCCRAEEYNPKEKSIDLFVSFEMVEHLHNPSIFFRRLAKKTQCEHLLMTVPYRKSSRVGLHHLRCGIRNPISAEKTHIFELSPNDWTLLIRHSGWKIIHSEIFFQYPTRFPMMRQVLAAFWKKTDFEGFWGVLLKKDLEDSDLYQDWEE